MHIKTGTWESNGAGCESDTFCDLVSATNSEPHIRNRRLSPGSGNCRVGGGGGCISGGDQQRQQLSPESDPMESPLTNTYNHRREKERKGQQHKSRSLRRDSQKGVHRSHDRSQKVNQKERWPEDSLSLLKLPPAFPVQDSPAKLQPAVSYASKVKAGAPCGALDDDRPAIGDLLQNQWGLSFISEVRTPTESSGLHPSATASPPQPTDINQPPDLQINHTTQPREDTPTPAPTFTSPVTCPEVDEGNGKLLLSCRHLVEALNYHCREWNGLCNKQKKGKRLLWESIVKHYSSPRFIYIAPNHNISHSKAFHKARPKTKRTIQTSVTNKSKIQGLSWYGDVSVPLTKVISTSMMAAFMQKSTQRF
ncbi:uncharacterized protein LOC117524984 isoform X1 [Thalassophryne amazonica]|uniref:uncharacterized protein LOC117524984 isoform X1 n=1 Tax=Thalassophryne amazonica TaxID=390379 RepID=UPI001471F87F|nr:uncharacterized protein LOC117524984 isoform X1 [Thalassophryne amazonica]